MKTDNSSSPFFIALFKHERMKVKAPEMFELLKEVRDYKNQVFDDAYLLRVESLIKEIEGE